MSYVTAFVFDFTKKEIVAHCPVNSNVNSAPRCEARRLNNKPLFTNVSNTRYLMEVEVRDSEMGNLSAVDIIWNNKV